LALSNLELEWDEKHQRVRSPGSKVRFGNGRDPAEKRIVSTQGMGLRIDIDANVQRENEGWGRDSQNETYAEFRMWSGNRRWTLKNY